MGKTDRSRRRRSVAEIVARAHQAVDDAAVAREWLRTPHPLLGGASPLDRMDTRREMEEGTTILAQVEHGMPVSPSVLLNDLGPPTSEPSVQNRGISSLLPSSFPHNRPGPCPTTASPSTRT
ncbi:MAG: antitoxin Xre/MbcA/ParS toxin-binding domain-containing protein [Salinibacter sp.]